MNTDKLVKENVSETENLITSTPPSQKPRGEFKNTPKFHITVDNLRLIGYWLPKTDERYTEDTFEIKNWYRHAPGDSAYVKEILKHISLDPVIELRYTYYKADRITNK